MKKLIWYVVIHPEEYPNYDNYDAINVKKLQIFLLIMMD